MNESWGQVKTFSATGNLNSPRDSHTATLLSNGSVLIAAGENGGTPLATSELYNPATKQFSLTGSLANARVSQTANLLNSGSVLIVGGWGQNSLQVGPAELYSPTSGTFSVTGDLNIPRGSAASGLLNDGTVLIVGGSDQYQYQGTNYFSEYVPQAEIYQPSGVAIEPPDSLQITPASANVLIGGTQSFTAIDSNGYPRQDVTWSVSNPSLASVTADENDRGVVTGIAAGQVTVTATAESVSGQAQVTISSGTVLNPGTTVWSAPTVPGYSSIQLVQAVPNNGGPDLYSIQLSSDGTHSIVQALTADGQQLWQTPIAAPLTATSVPDGAGGLIVTEWDTCASGQQYPLSLVDLDPVYGQPTTGISAAGVQQGNYVTYCYGNGDAPQMAVRGDGALFVAEPTNNGFPQYTEVANGNYVSLPAPTTMDTENGNQISVQCCMGPPMVNTDETAYVEEESRTIVNNVITSDTLILLGLPDSNANATYTTLGTTTQNEALLPGPIIPDGNGGVIATWTISPSTGPVPQYPYQAVDVVGGVAGTPYNLPFSPSKVTLGQSPTLVLGENGVAFASGITTASDGVTQVSQIASFNLSSGSTNWAYQAASGNHLSIIASSAGNTLAAKNTDSSGNDTVLRFNSGGVPTSDGWTGTSVSYFLTGNIWLGSSSATSPSGIYASPVILSTSAWYEPDGNTGNAAVQDVSLTNFSQTGTNQTTITNVLQKIQGQLPSYSTCNNWLQGAGQNQGTSGLQQIQGLVTNNLFGHATINVGPSGGSAAPTYTIAAFSGTQNPDKTNIPGLPAGAAMTVNDIGAFFNQTDNQGNRMLIGEPEYPGGSPQAQSTILVHEIAHQITVSGFQPDFGNKRAGKANDHLVNANCKTMIEAH